MSDVPGRAINRAPWFFCRDSQGFHPAGHCRGCVNHNACTRFNSLSAPYRQSPVPLLSGLRFYPCHLNKKRFHSVRSYSLLTGTFLVLHNATVESCESRSERLQPLFYSGGEARYETRVRYTIDAPRVACRNRGHFFLVCLWWRNAGRIHRYRGIV